MPAATSKTKSAPNVFARRLKAARLRAALSQKALGIKAGIDEFVASSRMNQYERSTHLPDYPTARRLAKALGVPVAYLYSDNDDEADLLLRFKALSKAARADVLKKLQDRKAE